MDQNMDQQRKQKRLGPAPIASFEDTSDEMDSSISSENRLPNIRECDSLTKDKLVSSFGQQPSSINLAVHHCKAPRIDISRASSSSHHEDSRDSSPENVFEQVGTGTLQETASGLGFREEGAVDLRSSTEELYFMEPITESKEKAEHNTFATDFQIRRSPIMFKFDEQQAACLQQNQRKDSASSEVAALLCISGRTSRISSVGSQGSAISRLSAVSGISRSPSPHKMLLETSFCGPKPVESLVTSGSSTAEAISAEILEQVILARRHDPTRAVIAEGIHIDTSTPKRAPKITNGIAIEDSIKVDVKTSRPSRTSAKRGTGVLKNTPKTIIGTTPSGVEYIRIKLKPDHLYGDQGLSDTERVIDDGSDTLRKPATLSLSQEKRTKKAPTHFNQLIQPDDSITKHPDQKLTPSASPKPGRHLMGDSRSPSPATITVSRKSSFCSLFKSKEVSSTASPESPTLVSGQRKRSGISVLLGSDSPRDRSRSKSRESDRIPSQNSTPSKQRSVLAIFKPRNGGKSKSASPVDSEAIDRGLSHIDFQFRNNPSIQSVEQSITTKVNQRLRYYDEPSDGKCIHIPLHTPPDEQEDSKNHSKVFPVSRIESVIKLNDTPKACPVKKEEASVQIPAKQKYYSENKEPVLGQINYQIEYPDGSIRIPLKSPTDNNASHTFNLPETSEIRQISREMSETDIQIEIEKCIEVDQPNVTTIEKYSSREPTADMTTILNNSANSNVVHLNRVKTPASHVQPPALPTPIIPITQSQHSHVPPQPQIPTSIPSRERKRILFSTKIGSGSEEQIFATQLSLSKTESICSQLSEQMSIPLDSPNGDKIVEQKDSKKAEQDIDRSQMRNELTKRLIPIPIYSIDNRINKEESRNSNRHSMYIDNIDKIMVAQRKQIASESNQFPTIPSNLMRESKIDCIDSEGSIEKRKPEPVLQIPGPPPTEQIIPNNLIRSTEISDNPINCIELATMNVAGGSSESERDSETDPNSQHHHHHHRHDHVPHQVGAVEEESTGLVGQQDSFDDEIPYVPTTLPEERSVRVPLIPIKERAHMDVKTCPVDRPRSTTPLNPSFLEDYCGTIPHTDDTDHTLVRGTKLRISLPKKDPTKERHGSVVTPGTPGSKTKSPRRTSNSSGKSWFEFAEQGIGPGSSQMSSTMENNNCDEPPPPLPPKKLINQSNWIDFENIPEKRKPPKRITTLPSKDSMDKIPAAQINYVNPEECQCECHENEREQDKKTGICKDDSDKDKEHSDDAIPLFERVCVDRNSKSDSSMDISYDTDDQRPPQSTQQEAKDDLVSPKIRKNLTDSSQEHYKPAVGNVEHNRKRGQHSRSQR